MTEVASPPTSSERAALLAICQPGAKESSAARQLDITEHALRSRLRRLYAKLGVNSAGQAAYVLGLSAGSRSRSSTDNLE